MVRRLILANGVIYGLSLLLYLTADPILLGTLRVLGLNPSLWSQWFPFLPLWQLLTHGFLHGIGPLHVLWNMLLLFFFGTMLEGILGSRRFLVTYFACMLAGAAAHLVLALHPPFRANAIGASGAVLGVLAVLATLRPQTRVIVLFIPVTLKVLAIGIFALNFIGLLLQSKGGSGGTAYGVHLGGFLFGYLATRRRWIWQDPVAAAHKKLVRSRQLRQIQDDQRMDELLAKIHREGMSSLTRAERNFLKRVAGKR
jgi:membrane associated rhomboid family serine protease